MADQLAYRLFGLGWKGHGPAVTTEVERFVIDPSVTWRPDADTSLTVIANYQRDPKSGVYRGFSAIGMVCPHNFGDAVVARLPADFTASSRSERSARPSRTPSTSTSSRPRHPGAEFK